MLPSPVAGLTGAGKLDIEAEIAYAKSPTTVSMPVSLLLFLSALGAVGWT